MNSGYMGGFQSRCPSQTFWDRQRPEGHMGQGYSRLIDWSWRKHWGTDGVAHAVWRASPGLLSCGENGVWTNLLMSRLWNLSRGCHVSWSVRWSPLAPLASLWLAETYNAKILHRTQKILKCSAFLPYNVLVTFLLHWATDLVFILWVWKPR